MSFFDYQDKDLTKIQNDNKVESLIYNESENYDLIVISDYYLSEKEIHLFKDQICETACQYVNLKIIYPFKFIPSSKELTKQIGDFYFENTIDLTKYVHSNSKIITIGRAIYAITHNTDFSYDSFYDIIFNKTCFYSSKLQSYIFPINSWNEFFNKDNWENYFSFYQIKKAFNFKSLNVRQPKLNLIKLQTSEQIDEFLLKNMEEKEVAWDIETDGLNFMSNRIGCLTLSFDGVTGYYLNWGKIDKKLLNEFFKNKYQILANGKFDCKFLKYNGIGTVKVDFDTYAAGHVLNEMRSNSLKTHAWLYTNYGGYESDLDSYKKQYKNMKNYLDIPEDILSKYAIMDAIITFQTYKEMKKQLKEIDQQVYTDKDKWNLSNYYYAIVIPSINLFSEMEYDGVYINWNKVRDAEIKITKEIKDIEKELQEFFNEDINWSSNDQLGKLIQKKGWSNQGISKKGIYLVNDSTLTEWEKEGHKGASLILKLHELQTLMGTFIGEEKNNSGFYQYKNVDNKVHCNFGAMIADSGRNTCNNPNLQNQPKHGDNAKMIRGYYCPPNEDYLIAEFDAAGFQLRIGAALSNDPFMKKAFIELGGDLHSMTAAEILMNNKVTTEEFIIRKKEKEFKEKRFKAKACNFGFLFGATGIKFSEGLQKEWTLEEVEKYLIENNLTNKPYSLQKNDIALQRQLSLKDCKYWAVGNDIRKKYFEKYSGLSKWHEQTISFAEEHGYVKSTYGAIRRLPQLLYKGKQERSFLIKNLQNIALNSPVQNFEVCKINLTMIELNKWLKENSLKSKIAMTVHDSIVMYIYREELKMIILKIKEIFERSCEENNNIPMEIEWDVSDYEKNEVWGFGKELKLSDL